MIGNVWDIFLYQPLFNFLIWIYNNWTNANFGWAVVYLTVMLRIVLLPFTLITERDRIKNEEIAAEIKRLEQVYRNDPILKKEQIRKALKERRVNPWAKVIVLGIQLLVLILLYQVFLRGITGEKILKILYPAVHFPGVINLNFLGFDLAKRHDIIWPGMVAIFLMVETYVEFRRYKTALSQSDLFYFILFPTAVFFTLWWLPMVKSLFVLTSMLFSAIIYQFSKVFFGRKKDGEKSTHSAH